MEKLYTSFSGFVLFCAILFSSLLGSNVSAQTYPVQTNISTSGPYLNYLSYYGDQNNHLQITVTNLDFNEPPMLARLRIRIEGAGYELYTNPNATVGQPFLLDAGMPLVISGIELLPYLQQSNLINPSGVDLNNLPHGFTTICVDVIRESASQQVLSTNNCGFIPIQEYQPPQTFIPTCGDVLDTNTMFHTFTWTPPVPFPAGAGIELFYDFSIYQWADPNNNSALNGNSILIYEETDLIAPTTQVSDFNVIFELGRTYVWKVTARVESNGMPISLIENGGVSAPCTFIYGEAPTLNDVLADGLEIQLFTSPSSERKGKAWWTVTDNTPNAGLSTFDAYFVEYRKQPTGNEGFEIPWFSKTLSSFEHFIYQLEPSTTYEVKVSGVIAGTVGDPTPIETFTTPDPRIYNCGESDVPYLPTNYTPLENATAGTQVKIGQFMMTMTEVTAIGSAGHYKGKGEIPIAFLAGAKAKVRFDDILIDTEYLVHEGRVDVITEGLANWLDDQYQQFIDPYFVEGTIDSAYVQDSVAWVVVDGVPQSFNFDPPNYPIIVNDESGNQYTIYPNGTIVVGTYLSVSETWSVAANQTVRFGQNDNESRGFDPKEHQEWHENYETMQLGDNSFYYVANKSMAKNETDKVNVQFPPNIAHVRFELSNGDTIPFANLDGSWMGNKPYLDSGLVKTLNLPSFSSSGKKEIYAFANGIKVGQLNIQVYSKKDKEVVVVPIANSNISATQIKAELDQTLGEANIDVNVTVESQWTDSTGTFTASSNVSMPSEVGLLSKYSDDMRGIRDAYFEQHPSAPKYKYYLFLVNGFDDPNELGYMVRGRSMGFVKADPNNTAQVLQTISHELGHGMGALEHTFKDEVLAKGSTNNLMDYSSNPTNLTKAQWKELRDLDVVPSLWDSAEDGSGVALSVSTIPARFKNADSTLSFFSGDDLGKIITLPPNTIDVYLSTSDPFMTGNQLSGYISPIGSLKGFSIDNGTASPSFYKAILSPTFNAITYKLSGVIENTEVTGSGTSNGNQAPIFDIQSTDNLDTLLEYSNVYVDPYTKSLSNPVVIAGLPFYEGGEIGYTLYPVEANAFTQPTANENSFGFVSSSPFMILSRVKSYNQSGNGVALPNVNPDLINYREWFELHNGEGVSVSSNYGSEDMSPLALGYLDKFEGYTKKGSVLAPILIGISEWVTRLETSEVYSNCVLDSDMPIALSFFQPESSSFNQPFTSTPIEIVDPYQQMNANPSPTVMQQNWLRADEAKIQQIEDFYVKFINVFNGVVGGNGLTQDINSELTPATTSQQIVSVLRDYTLCDYEVISFDNRMKCINLIQNSDPYTELSTYANASGIISAWGQAWTAQEYNESLVVKLVNGTKYNGQSDAMSSELFKNNSSLFWEFFNYTDGAEYHAFMNTLLELTMVYNQTNPNITIDFGQFENNKVMRSTDHQGINRFKFELQQSNTQGLYYTLLNSVSPETLVTVDLTTDIKLSNLSYFYEDFVGDQITIPAFYLYYMEDQRMQQNLTKAVMVLLDLAVIVGSAGTATPYAIASIALAGSNIVVTLNEDAIAGLNGGQDFLNVWSLVQVVDGVNGLAQIGKGVGKKISGSSLKLFFSLDNMSVGLAQVRTSSAYLEAAESLAKVRRLWYFMQFSGENVIANMMKSKMMMKLEAKVLKKNFVKIDPATDLEIANLYNVKVLDGNNSTNVLTMNPNSEGAFLSGNIMDDIPENSLVVARFDDVRFNSGSPTIQEGDLVIYKKTNGSFVVVKDASNLGGSLSTRVLNSVSDANLVIRVKSLRQQLTSSYKKSGNFGHADVNVPNINKNEYYAHSGIQELTGDLPNRVPDISLRPTQSQEIFPYSTELNSAGTPIPRNIDTEYKILTELANDIGDNFGATGTVKLFTERPPCSSCSNVISLFSNRYPNLTIEIIHNNGTLLTNF